MITFFILSQICCIIKGIIRKVIKPDCRGLYPVIVLDEYSSKLHLILI